MCSLIGLLIEILQELEIAETYRRPACKIHRSKSASFDYFRLTLDTITENNLRHLECVGFRFDCLSDQF